MSLVRTLVVFGVCVLFGLAGCSSTGGAPVSIAGTWEFQIVGSTCPEAGSAVFDLDGSPASFQVAQSGINVSAQFVDAGSQCTLNATYRGDEVRGSLVVEDGARVITGTVEGYARVFGNERQVDGWVRIESDTGGPCENAIIEFCAKVMGEQDDTVIIQQCPPVDIVFIMDTSGSLEDEAEAICEAISGVEQNLTDLGLEQIRTRILGITETTTVTETGSTAPSPEFDCLENSVYREVGGDGENHPQVPGNPWPRATYERDAGNIETIDPSVLNPFDDESEEYWGPATALIAAGYAWLPSATGEPPTVRIIVPISDESPQTGRDECWTVDRAAVDNAARVSVENAVRVSPILGFNSNRDPCIAELMQRLATRTGGIFLTTSPAVQGADTTTDPLTEEIANFIFQIVLAACEGRSGTVPLPPLPAPPPAPTQLPDSVETLIAFDENGEPFLIDPATAVATPMFEMRDGTDPAAEIENPVVSSSVYVPSRGEYWLGTGERGDLENSILVLDVSSGAVTVLNADSSAFPGLAIDGSGNVFAKRKGLLLSLDTQISPGASTVVGSGQDGPGNGITFGGTTLLGSIGTQLYTIDTTNGQTLLIGPVDLQGFSSVELAALGSSFAINSMTTASDATIYGILQQRAGGGGFPDNEPAFLVRIEPGGFLTGETISPVATRVGLIRSLQEGSFSADGLAFVPTSILQNLPRVSPRID